MTAIMFESPRSAPNNCFQYYDLDKEPNVNFRTFNYPWSIKNGLIQRQFYYEQLICFKLMAPNSDGQSYSLDLTTDEEFRLDVLNRQRWSFHNDACPSVYIELLNRINGYYRKFCGGKFSSARNGQESGLVQFMSNASPMVVYIPPFFQPQITAVDDSGSISSMTTSIGVIRGGFSLKVSKSEISESRESESSEPSKY